MATAELAPFCPGWICWIWIERIFMRGRTVLAQS